MRPWMISVGFVLSAAGATIAQPVTPTQRPTTMIKDCTTSGCHASQVDRPFLHGPNAVRACDACHESRDETKHTFGLKREGRALCDFCHIDKTGTEGAVVHKPLQEGKCLGCHDPHGSGTRRMLKKSTIPEMCQTCHTDINKGSHVHKPAGENCAACHKPHTADEKHLLTMPEQQLCRSCHAEVGKTVDSAAHPHDPAKGSCLECHRPHASDAIKVLKDSPAALCASCHPKPAEIAAHATFKHAPMTDERACLNCHVPHGSTRPKQLAADQTKACLACHAKEIKAGADRVITAIPELANAKLAKHGPISEDDCAACHAVHGGERASLLAANYSMQFYQTFTDDAYALCFRCHDKGLISAADAAKNQTGFRDGLRNLHTVHVDRGDNGRSCRSCHTVHVSKFAQQINDAVPFGGWSLPIGFKPSETGGSCSPGCHKPAGYDRSKGGAPAESPLARRKPALTPSDGPAPKP